MILLVCKPYFSSRPWLIETFQTNLMHFINLTLLFKKVCNCISIIECVDKWNISTNIKTKKNLFLFEHCRLKSKKKIQFSCLKTFYIVLENNFHHILVASMKLCQLLSNFTVDLFNRPFKTLEFTLLFTIYTIQLLLQ